MSFTELGVPDDLIDALRSKGIDAPFPIQAETIPPALAGRHVSGRAPTGSGKTLAFGIPLVANVARARPKRPRGLVLVPTRELAAQVCRDLEWLGRQRDVRVHAFYGGTRFETQIKALRRGVDIAVACPGRLTDLVDQGMVRLDGVDLVVVDEADRMADMGFLPDVRRLVDQTDEDRQMLLFSATLDGDVDELVRRYQHDPITVDVTPAETESLLEHHFWAVSHARRVDTTAAIIDRVGPTIVFTRTRYGADRVARQLEGAGVDAVAIHGNRTQSQRERALRAFRTGHAQALVATDVAARGIHVDDVSCVVHFDLPTDPKDYVHRSGRTGRAGATGIVIALAVPDRRKDTDKLLRELHLGATVTVTDPDVDSLPKTERFARTRPARQDRGPKRQGDARRPGGGAKPTGNKRKPVPGSPRTTRAGRAKHAGSRHDDPRRGDDRGLDRDTRPRPGSATNHPKKRRTSRTLSDDGFDHRHTTERDDRSNKAKPPKRNKGRWRDDPKRSGDPKSAGYRGGDHAAGGQPPRTGARTGRDDRSKRQSEERFTDSWGEVRRTRSVDPREPGSRHAGSGASQRSTAQTNRGTGPRRSKGSDSAHKGPKFPASGSKSPGGTGGKAKPTRNKKQSGGAKRSGKNRRPSH